jgi:alcohol dehydrogenase (cytochrome c)
MASQLINHGFPPVNRGVAILEQTIFVGTLDAHLYALDASSGSVRWKVKLAENNLGYAITCAPLIVGNKVIIGVSGGEAGIRGFLDAYDAQSGERIWRFHTIPGEGEKGNDTWGGDSWKTGGGPTWITGSYDPDLNLIYWGVGNPGPDWNGDVRPGDNLYTCSMLALDAETGKLSWHFQFTPHDTHDWDANQTPVLVDLRINGQLRKCLVTANRNGFYYILDRTDGGFIKGVEFATQTWAKGLDSKGRPIVLPNTEPTEDGVLIYPSLQGATNWASPAFHPGHRLYYVAVREMGSYYYKREVEYEPGAPFLGGGEQALSGDNAYGAVRALDVNTGQRKWEFKVTTPMWVGVMSTGGNLVFGSTNEGNFFALHAKTGAPLWDFQLGAEIRSNPISYMVDGKQYVMITAGNGFFAFSL